MTVNTLLVAVPNVFRSIGRHLSIVYCLLALTVLSAEEALGESRYFSVKIKSIEAMLVDRATGELSSNILEADSMRFLSTGQIAGRHPTADDVFLRVRLTAEDDGNIQPPITLAVLQHLDALEGPFARVIYWRHVGEYPPFFDKDNQGALTVLLKDVTCSKLDVVVNISGGKDSHNSDVTLLPFECKE